jgi:ABC-2 type transport system ATP-binding protein
MMNTTQDTAVVCDGLSKSFGRRRSLAALLRHPLQRAEMTKALDGVELSVHQGEIFGLLGPNGAGKTTLLKILSGLVLPDKGQARVNGADIASQEMAVRRAIGYVTSDERSFYWRLSGRQNLIFFARLFHVPEATIPQRVADLLERVDLSSKASEPFSAYSSGMKQRLAIARALLHAPPILFLDEPTRSLDPVTARHIRDFIRDQLSGEEGKTILLATHNLHEAAALCHRMAILNRGRVQRTGRLEEFRALFAAQRIYRVEMDRQVDLEGAGRILTTSQDEATGSISVELQLHDSVESSLSRLVGILAASGARVEEITRQEPPLEDLFDRLFHEDGREGEA